MHREKDVQIIWPWEELCAQVGGSIVHGTVRASLRGIEASGSRRCCVVGFVKSVRGDNNDMEISSITISIAGSCSLKSRAP